MAAVMTIVVGTHRMVVLMTREVDGWRIGQCEYDCTTHEGQQQEVVCVQNNVRRARRGRLRMSARSGEAGRDIWKGKSFGREWCPEVSRELCVGVCLCVSADALMSTESITVRPE